MCERIEAFLDDILALEREDPSVIPRGVRFHLAVYEKQFRDAEANKRMKGTAAQVCRRLCRTRVVKEMPRHKGISTAERLMLVLSGSTRMNSGAGGEAAKANQ